MKVTPTAIPDVLVIEPVVHGDDRGFFLEVWHARRYAGAGVPAAFVQDNHSGSVQGTLRGLHYQTRNPQGKLVGVVTGAVFDVAVDLRPGSATFGRWLAQELHAEKGEAIYIPSGFAHGYQTLLDDTELQYLATAPFAPKSARGVRFDDPAFGISWPLPVTAMSDADRNWSALDRSSLDFSAPGQPKSGN